MKKSVNVMILLLLLSIIACSDDKTANNSDNNKSCETVIIGNQVWMCKNLNVDHYRNGDLIPEIRDSVEWINLKSGAWCYYNNDSSFGQIFGKLYNWYAVNDPRGLAPAGWHIPSEEEWSILADYLGGFEVAGGKLKESGTKHWFSPNSGATNESGFTALPGGWRASTYWEPFVINGAFSYMGSLALWWSATDSNATKVSFRAIYHINYGLFNYPGNKVEGFSVRCIKDK